MREVKLFTPDTNGKLAFNQEGRGTDAKEIYDGLADAWKRNKGWLNVNQEGCDIVEVILMLDALRLKSDQVLSFPWENANRWNGKPETLVNSPVKISTRAKIGAHPERHPEQLKPPASVALRYKPTRQITNHERRQLELHRMNTVANVPTEMPEFLADLDFTPDLFIMGLHFDLRPSQTTRYSPLVDRPAHRKIVTYGLEYYIDRRPLDLGMSSDEYKLAARDYTKVTLPYYFPGVSIQIPETV